MASATDTNFFVHAIRGKTVHFSRGTSGRGAGLAPQSFSVLCMPKGEVIDVFCYCIECIGAQSVADVCTHMMAFDKLINELRYEQ